ncbi:MAG: hypothetical protein HOP33_17890 [Verrucomicrobia bacterium]|nr:hypothetical protein [Verrucomicrobiota bacterium]
MNSERTIRHNCHTVLSALLAAFGCLQAAQANPTIISPLPANGASPSAAFVFVFSEPMDTAFTGVDFINIVYFTNFTTSDVWSGGNTILTCTPSPAFPANQLIVWSAFGQNPNGDPLDEPTGGFFTTGGGSGGGGSGTNAITTFSVGKVHHYQQTSAGAPTLDPTTPYGFSGVTSLSSNRTATTATLTTPTTAVYNLFHLPPPSAEIFLLSTNITSLSTFDAAFPAGNYSFFVQAATSNQTVVVNLPTTNSMAQPNAPHLTNYLAAQLVNPNQAFVLGWDAFPGGTAADYIDVDVGSEFGSPNPGLPGALTGAARTFTIPAGTLLPNTTYSSQVGFFRFVGATNANYVTAAYRATYTEFSLITTGSGQLVLTNASWTPGTFSFDVLCSPGQVTVEYRTNLATGVWQTLLTTNSPGNIFHAIAPQAVTNRLMFFRARNGS